MKDIVSIANSAGDEVGYLFFGVDLASADPVVGLSRSYDDATLQQIVAGKLERPVSFLYYELEVGANRVGIIAIPPSRRRPHIVRVNYGSLREGMIPIRRGSSTSWATSDELSEMFTGRPASEREELRDLIQRSADPLVKTSTLAIQAWDLARRLGDAELERWLRFEIVGIGEGDMAGSEIPTYRECTAYITAGQINPYSLAYSSLETLAVMHPDDFTETTLRFGFTLSHFEETVESSDRRPGVLYRRKEVETTDGKMVEAWIYFVPDCFRSILSRVRDRICSSLIELQLKESSKALT